MKAEALDALTNKTMRPQALEAAATQNPNEDTPQAVDVSTDATKDHNLEQPHSTSTKPATPFGERTDGTESAARLVDSAVRGMKVAVDGALAWAEKKTDELSAEEDSTGPYTSPATCVPSDLDAIASGILPAMPTQRQSERHEGGANQQKQTGERNDSVTESKK
ncbi:Nn.00g110580.m01.CDS01 [Neocucurbitaria sp. VM-36]